MKSSSARTRACALGVAIAIVVTCMASPCAGAEGVSPPGARVTATPSLLKLSNASQAILRASTQQAVPATEPSPFFKTKKGATVLVLIGAGFGYALYSRFHDEIKSPIRE